MKVRVVLLLSILPIIFFFYFFTEAAGDWLFALYKTVEWILIIVFSFVVFVMMFAGESVHAVLSEISEEWQVFFYLIYIGIGFLLFILFRPVGYIWLTGVVVLLVKSGELGRIRELSYRINSLENQNYILVERLKKYEPLGVPEPKKPMEGYPASPLVHELEPSEFNKRLEQLAQEPTKDNS